MGGLMVGRRTAVHLAITLFLEFPSSEGEAMRQGVCGVAEGQGLTEKVSPTAGLARAGGVDNLLMRSWGG